MLVPPQIVARPGDNHTASTGCMFTGSVHPADGPYLVTTVGNFSRGAVKELAEALDLLVSETAQAKFEKLFTRLIEAETTIKSRRAETRELTAGLEATQAELARVTKERDKLAETLAKTESDADVIRGAVSEILNPKGNKKSV